MWSEQWGGRGLQLKQQGLMGSRTGGVEEQSVVSLNGLDLLFLSWGKTEEPFPSLIILNMSCQSKVPKDSLNSR